MHWTTLRSGQLVMEKPTPKPLQALITIAFALVASPAQAAELGTNKQCYQAASPDGTDRPVSGEPVTYTGGPFRPFSTVDVALDGIGAGSRPVFATGIVAGRLTAPDTGGAAQRPFTLTVTDPENPALTATATRLASEFNVTVQPGGGAAAATRRRINARGFTNGGTLYAHVVRGRSKRNLRIGRLTGACGDLRVKRRLFAAGARRGTYRVQFDTSRRYSGRTVPRVTFRVRISRVFAPRSGAAAGRGEEWTRVS